MKKRFRHPFFRTIEHDICQKTFFKDPQAFLTIILELIGAFFRTWEVVENKIFEEKSKLSSEKKWIDQF